MLLRNATRIRPNVVRVRNGLGATVWAPRGFYSRVRALHTFGTANGGITGWTGGTGATGSADALTQETSNPLAGTASLRVTRLWSGGTDWATAISPDRAVGARDLRETNVAALGALVAVLAGTRGSGWQARIHVLNSAGSLVAESGWVPIRVGVTERVWAPFLPSVLADVKNVGITVQASGVNTTASVLVDSIDLGAAGALYPEDPNRPGSSELWRTAFATATPKAELHVEAVTEQGTANLSFPAVDGVPRARVSFPSVGVSLGYRARTRLRDLGATDQTEAVFEYEVLLPASVVGDLTTRDLRLPALAALPDDQPGTYTSMDGVLRADSWSGLLHLRGSGGTGLPWAEAIFYGAGVGETPGVSGGLRFPLRRDLLTSSSSDRSAYWSPPADVPVRVRQRVRTNTPGVADGHWDIWLDGVQYLRLRDVMWRGTSASPPLNQVIIEAAYRDGGAASTGRYVDVLSMRLKGVGGLAVPAAPGEPTVGTVTETSVALTWAAVPDATSYDLARDAIVIARGLSTAYTDSGLTPATAYLYQVRAVNAAGASDLGTAVTATTEAGNPSVVYLPGDSFDTAFGAKWLTPPAAARIDAGRGALDYVAGTYQSIQTAPQDWTGKAACLEVLSTAPAGSKHFFSARVDSSNYYEMYQDGSTLGVQRRVAGALTQRFTTTFSASQHRWWRIRMDGDQVIFETSPDGAAWSAQFRETAQVNMSVARERIMAFAPTGVTGTFLFDNNNMGSVDAPSSATPLAPSTSLAPGAALAPQG